MKYQSKNQSLIITATICLTIVGMTHMIAGAGPLDPPVGPVSSTGRTLSEIYDAVLLGGGGGEPCVPGAPQGQFFLSVEGRAPMSLIGYDYPMISALGGGGGVPFASELTITKDLGLESLEITQCLFGGTVFKAVGIELHSWEGNPRFKIELTNARVERIHQTANVQCDGSSRQLEHVTFTFERIQIKDLATGKDVCWDFLSNQGC